MYTGTGTVSGKYKYYIIYNNYQYHISIFGTSAPTMMIIVGVVAA